MAHSIYLCMEHGSVIRQCRCPGPHPKVRINCPGIGVCPDAAPNELLDAVAEGKFG